MVNNRFDLESENFTQTRTNANRSSLRNFKNWTPFNENTNTEEIKNSIKDDYILSNTKGIVKRMANSISSQLLNRSTNQCKSKANLNSCVKSFQFRGNFQVEETEDGIKILLKQPHLISVIVNTTNIDDANSSLNKKDLTDCSSDANHSKQANKTSIKIYPLKVGRTTIGSSDKNDIIINGPGVEPEHCFIENKLISLANNSDLLNDKTKSLSSFSSFFKSKSKSKENLANSANLVTLYPIADLCAIDGVLIEKPYNLVSGSVICLGESEYYKYNNPDEDTITSTSNLDNNNNLPSIKLNKHENKMLANNELKLQQEPLQLNHQNDNKLIEPNYKDKRASKVRFNLPEDQINSCNKETNLNNNSETKDFIDLNAIKVASIKTNSNANKNNLSLNPSSSSSCSINNLTKNQPHQQSGDLVKRKSPSKTFLSKLNKFELLSRGIDIKQLNEPSSSSSSSTPTTSESSLSCSIDKQTITVKSPSTKPDQTNLQTDNKMLRHINNKSEYLQMREVRSKSFGCEKELYIRKNKNSSKKSTPCKAVKPASNKKHFHIEDINLNYIDDEDISENKRLVNDYDSDEDDDYDDNVIYEGDSDEINDEFLIDDDFDKMEDLDENNKDYDHYVNDTDSASEEEEELLKCRSAPISPSREQTLANRRQEKTRKNTVNCASFIYDMNLYNDKQNSNENNLKRLKINQNKLAKLNRSSESSSSSSLNSTESLKLEPLVIHEEKLTDETTNSTQTTVIMKENVQNEIHCLNLVLDDQNENSQSSLTSSISSSLTNLNQNSNQPSSSSTPTRSSSSSNDENEKPMSEKETTKLQTENKNDDTNSLPDENSQASSLSAKSSANLLSESQYYLKDNYEKAKRERQIEQELAEMEKKRLQEILDICMEFQRQEQKKSSDNNTTKNNQTSTVQMQSSSTSSSISSSSSSSAAGSSNQQTHDLNCRSVLNANNQQQQHQQEKQKDTTSSHSNSTLSQNTTISALPSLNSILTNSSIHQKAKASNRNSTSSNQSDHQQNQQQQNHTKQQFKIQLDKLNREKCELITNLNFLKQKIQEIEMRQNEAIRELEMERALLDVEHNTELKNLQNDEVKLKHLQQEHQLRLEAFNLHTNQIRGEIEMVQMTIKNIENEILILDTTLDTNFLLASSTGAGLDSSMANLESIKAQKEHSLEEARRAHEDLEFQLMELEAKYETELEDIQNRLIKEQDSLLNLFKHRHASLSNYDQEQTKILLQVKSETEILEQERQNLIEQFKKQRNQLQMIEKKLNKLQQTNEQSTTTASSDSTSSQSPCKRDSDSNEHDLPADSPSPASSSVSLSSATNSLENNPIKEQVQQQQPQQINPQFNRMQISSPLHATQTPNRYIPPLVSQNRMILPHLNQLQNQLLQTSLNQSNKSQQYKKQLSQSFRDILENTLLINGIGETNRTMHSSNYMNQSAIGKLATLSPVISQPQQNQRFSKCLNKSTSSLNNNINNCVMGVSAAVSNLTQPKIAASLNSSQQILYEYLEPTNPQTNNPSLSQLPSTNLIELLDENEDAKLAVSPNRHQVPSTPVLVNTQLALKFAELERNLALTKAENNNLLEQQFQARERELQLLNEEKRKREELERQLNEEKHLREKIAEENIKLRDKKQTQARPLTRYLPVRDNNFDLKQHVENSGHHLMNQIDPNTKQPLIFINSYSCRGYLLKMGQKFKTWNKRWFVFDRTKRTLCYYMDKHENKLRGSIYFQSINEVYVDHMRTIKSPDPKSTFVVKTLNRNFHLVAPSSELMRIWIDVIFTGAEGYLEFIE